MIINVISYSVVSVCSVVNAIDMMNSDVSQAVD
jgi:hypothetical protein